MDHVEAVKKGTAASLEKLLSEWRERFENDNDRATKEVLELVLQVKSRADVLASSYCHERTSDAFVSVV